MLNILSKRENIDYSVSFIRFIACIFIIICHILQYFGSSLAFWFNCGVQIFFFISGYLYSKKNLSSISSNIKFVINNSIKILIDYIIFCLIFVLVCIISQKIQLTNDNFINMIRIRNFPVEIGHLWFIKYILFCYFATPLYLKILDKLETKSPQFYFWIMLFLMVVNDLIFKGLFNFIGAWINCFLFGMIIYRLSINKKLSLNKVYFVVFIAAFLLNLLQIYIDYSHIELHKRLNSYIHWYAHATLGISLFVVLHYLYEKFKNIFEKCIVVFNLSDKYSYDIYICHHVFILGTFSILAINTAPVIKILFLITAIISSAYILNSVSLPIKQFLTMKVNKICQNYQ